MQRINGKPRAKIHIVSHSGERFQDRTQAGSLLAEELGELKGKNAVVLGIPRGGIVVAKELATRLKADLDIVLSRKLGAPGQPELAMGSVAEDGTIFLNQDVVSVLGVSRQYIDQEKARQMGEIRRRNELIRAVLPKTQLKDRIVVVTDDGLATGATMQAALWAVRNENPQKLIAAIPVASEEAVDRIAGDTDEIICLKLPPLFYAVGQFYLRFYQVTDEDVLKVLEDEANGRNNSTPPER